MHKRLKLYAISDSPRSEVQGGSKFSQVFLHHPILEALMEYLSLEDITRLSQALRYCSFTSYLSRIILYGYGAGKIQPPSELECEESIELLHMFVESKEVEIKDTSGLGLPNPFFTDTDTDTDTDPDPDPDPDPDTDTHKFQVARVVAYRESYPDEGLGDCGHRIIIGTLENEINFFYSAFYPSDMDQDDTIIGTLFFSNKWEDILSYDQYELEKLYESISVSLQLRNHLVRGPTGVYDHDEMVRLLVRAFYGRNQPD